MVRTGGNAHSENGSGVDSGPLCPKGLQVFDLLPSSDPSNYLAEYEPESKPIVPLDVSEDTGLRIESVFSYSDHQFIPVELQPTMTHWKDSILMQDNGADGVSDSSLGDSLAQTGTSTHPVKQVSVRQSPSDGSLLTDNPKHDSHSHRCFICQKTFRSLSTLHLHAMHSKKHNPSFTQYLKKVTCLQGPVMESQVRRSVSLTPCSSSPKQSLPTGVQLLSSIDKSSSAINHKFSSEILVCSDESEEIRQSKGRTCSFSKSFTTPVDLQSVVTDWLNDVTMEKNEQLNQTLIDECDIAYCLNDIPLQVSVWPMSIERTSDSQMFTQMSAEGTSASFRQTDIPKYSSKAYWCSMCQNIFISLHALQLHVKCCKSPTLSHWARSSRNRFLSKKAAGPDLCPPARFIPMSKHFYLALANGYNYHVCNICDLWCDDERSLGFHLKVHFWRRNYCCCLCDRAFHTQKSCWRHQEKHSSHPNYKCLTCGSSFTHYNRLKQHMGTAHKINLELSDNDTYEEVTSKAATYEMI
ncbi:hypothetical protein chiPu_0009864 [Chiloscyllium punctatum]|uniref:C2H2-type domain-containing protein n=1 Tax=Chiloscyllium punctatum TaxID=137246 RepID=A0A401SM07_CHIPU|nr:hypothetical protein [Chiloscyllium punctatum]